MYKRQAYYLSNESFYPEAIKKVVNKLKLRASVGRTGNDKTGQERFLYRPTFTTNAGGFTQGIGDTGGTNGIGNGIVEGRFAAPYLAWEIEDKQNYGFDLGLFDNRIDIIFDYFRSERRDILLQRRTVPQSVSYTHLLSIYQMEFYYSFNSFSEYIQREVFVRRMDRIRF